MARHRCIPAEPLGGELDPQAQATLMPASYVVKGMFFKQLVDRLGPVGWDEVAPSLRWAPSGGRYVAFKDYPQRDHFLLACAVAQRRYHAYGLREGLRRLARDDMKTFGDSTFGGVMLSLVRDPRGALRKVPAVYAKVAPGDWTITASDLDDGGVRLEFTDFFGDWAYTLGQLEGVVMHYHASPVVTVDQPSPEHVFFDVSTR